MPFCDAQPSDRIVTKSLRDFENNPSQSRKGGKGFKGKDNNRNNKKQKNTKTKFNDDDEPVEKKAKG